jgi:hypothetical protein
VPSQGIAVTGGFSPRKTNLFGLIAENAFRIADDAVRIADATRRHPQRTIVGRQQWPETIVRDFDRLAWRDTIAFSELPGVGLTNLESGQTRPMVRCPL